MTSRSAPGHIVRRRYTPTEDLAILELLQPRRYRLQQLAERLDRSPGAIERRYCRLVNRALGDVHDAVAAAADSSGSEDGSGPLHHTHSARALPPRR